MAVNQLSIFVENSKGKLLEVAESLADANINIRAMSIADTQDFGILRLIVDDNEKAKAKLEENGFIVSINQVVAVTLYDVPGALKNVIAILAKEGVNIEYMYAFIGSGHKHAYVVLRVEDNQKAEKILLDNNIRLLNEESIKTF
jgi:hypothetical protein